MRFSLSIGLCLGLFASAFGAIQKGTIEVGALQGPSDLLNREGKRAALSRGLVFQEGKRVETKEKSTAELLLSNGSTIKVNPNTLMEVKAFSQVASPLIVPGKYAELSAEPSPSVVQIEVYRGKIDGEVRKLNPNTQYTIKTPVGLVRVRGTVLSVSYTEGSNGRGKMVVKCSAGAVQVRPVDASATANVVPAGQQAEIEDEPDNVETHPNAMLSDLNKDGILDVPVDVDNDGKADGLDVNGDAKIDKFLSDTPGGRLNGIDTNADGVPDVKIDVDGDGSLEFAIDSNSDGIPDAVMSGDGEGFTKTPLSFPESVNAKGEKIEVKPVQPQAPPQVKVTELKPEPKSGEEKPEEPKTEEPKPEEPKPPAPPPPPENPSDDTLDNIVEKETQDPVSPSI